MAMLGKVENRMWNSIKWPLKFLYHVTFPVAVTVRLKEILANKQRHSQRRSDLEIAFGGGKH